MKKLFGVMLLSAAMTGIAAGEALAAKQAGGDRLRDQQKVQARDCDQTCQCDQDCQGTPIQDRDRDRDCWDTDDGGLLGFLKWMFGLR